ncbi:hypothetical protein M758_5G197100, partial [Ceratodon purpureus]
MFWLRISLGQELEMAVRLFMEAKRNGHRPNTSFYNALVTAHLLHWLSFKNISACSELETVKHALYYSSQSLKLKCRVEEGW